MKKELHELVIPPDVHSDPNAREIFRGWGAHGGFHVSIAAGIWTEPDNWGIALVDLARHVADYYEKTKGMRKEEVMSRIKEVLEAEWNHPADEPTGEVVQ